LLKIIPGRSPKAILYTTGDPLTHPQRRLPLPNGASADRRRSDRNGAVIRSFVLSGALGKYLPDLTTAFAIGTGFFAWPCSGEAVGILSRHMVVSLIEERFFLLGRFTLFHKRTLLFAVYALRFSTSKLT